MFSCVVYASLQSKKTDILEPEPNRTLVITEPEPCFQILDNNTNRIKPW